jgi:alginate O-acetyltransferase complex protein AlgI
MVFNSITFLVFLGIVLCLYYRLGHRGQNWLLLAASYVFYGWWDFRFAFLLLFTSAFDYACALWIERTPSKGRKKLFLTFSIVINMGVLCIFKYFNFFAESLEKMLTSMGLHAGFPTLYVILPVGISFYTFLSMSYTIDVYRSELKASRSPIDFFLYVSFFPHLVAGPIVRASYLLPQCQRPRTIQANEVVNGVWLILVGFVKKVVIADRLSQIVEWGFRSPTLPLNDANSWLIIYAFAFQIYGDFSGYSDIARGLSKLMGFELVVNFKAPYLVTNPSAFWRHWHISLSTWLRDYLYIPLGGNRNSRFQTYRNLMITMVLGGLWHGAGAAYLLWGFFHGSLLAIHRWWTEGRERTARESRIGRTLKVFLFFHVTCIGWLLFRAGSLARDQVEAVMTYLRAMFDFTLDKGLSPLFWPILLLGGLAFLFQWKNEEMDHFYAWKTRTQVTGVVLALIAITCFGIFEGAQFIYFQF